MARMSERMKTDKKKQQQVQGESYLGARAWLCAQDAYREQHKYDTEGKIKTDGERQTCRLRRFEILRTFYIGV
jgi:hypothetical protein